MSINQEQVKHVAKLSKLSFSEEEVVGLTDKLSEIITMVERLGEVDTTGVAVTTNVIHDINVMREDVAVEGTDRDLLMRNVPTSGDGYIKVPAMLDNGEAGA
ncbi:Asp-tRNA(Asn)/Glu-tRNA(Gln) amidotransferase subunit GatC [Vagococcus intermedius]|uniref:Aspartyl/glutamyl-tRNA(Asn/Gln) amidotransferase subunit C n=1 Tax=Vagococcus intermedius TaxID=2991418 RepID=A0AAF0CU43_9ENTE|nr:Asp-tRNA(Asn)/Glu-tRNA(Gln) amidotransferase subunit GatC [Vagococcus intermedius]WEG73008.1 Asp-tRNA(Asn)/Glu-tRNA(Gln) amidotransferase subunit GatC [Vagococcus intermedius]WEG75094.1 Asp-tRNA(Asn)/Glu-tRNA(Gln) amidotransferase subunit GatC [Vagococcus intermedius]